jgi:hypothetical protein
MVPLSQFRVGVKVRNTAASFLFFFLSLSIHAHRPLQFSTRVLKSKPTTVKVNLVHRSSEVPTAPTLEDKDNHSSRRIESESSDREAGDDTAKVNTSQKKSQPPQRLYYFSSRNLVN